MLWYLCQIILDYYFITFSVLWGEWVGGWASPMGGRKELVGTTSLQKLVYSGMWCAVMWNRGASLLEECCSNFLFVIHSLTTYSLRNTKWHFAEYKITLRVRSQSSVFRKIPVQNTFCAQSLGNSKLPPPATSFSDGELGKISCLMFGCLMQ